ncbi:MAG: FHA domain-containing protein [Anaerolinea thermophila]|uniref:FHA domain-containing protein n=1 Tax=Anaerolinea thermophila TaxID=167964 RepID=A0A101FX52_9CHLR|nr:MAG: FHA domain-containing protein [Anaerolinea thermophila]
MNNNLEQFETRLRLLFEENLIRLIPGMHAPRKLFDDLLAAMHENGMTTPEGNVFAPDEYKIHVPMEDLDDWKAHQDILNEMADFLHKTGFSESYNFKYPPSIVVLPQERLQSKDFYLECSISPTKPVLPDTAAIPNDERPNLQDEIPDRAYLIIGGSENFSLEKSVIDIGRHSDNDLILSEPHVSRHHAQLRAINKRYVIFDVGSTGGLFINGKKISQATLQPGDVIRIGMVNLIFVQDITSENPTTVMPIEDN